LNKPTFRDAVQDSQLNGISSWQWGYHFKVSEWK